jgi:UDPglucose--hexose-1-phosphate uridylyltransferase
LCAGNTRANGQKNPDYTSTYSFINDFSSLLEVIPDGGINIENLLVAKSEQGICKVICFSSRHDLTIPEMDVRDIRKVVDLWVKEYGELGAKDFINHVQIFENKGSVMGCSNPHPHGQIWSQSTVPMEPAKKNIKQKEYWDSHKRSLLFDYLSIELKERKRIIEENDHFVALAPFWAIWPFEAMIIPRRHIPSIAFLTDSEKDGLADIYRKLTIRYDNLFEVSFPYSAGIHQAPTDQQSHEEWHFHLCFYPPLLRSATIKKFMVGYEMLGNPQRDSTAEMTAARLRNVSQVHYKKR